MFYAVIALFAKSKSREGANDANRILQWQIGLYEKAKLYSNNAASSPKLDALLCPGSGHFITVMDAYSKRRGDSVEKVKELLVQREQLYESGESRLKPDYRSYVIYLDCIVKSQKFRAAEEAEKILDRLEELFLNMNDSENELNNYAYNSVMYAWANTLDRREGFIRASNIMQRMKALSKDTGNENLKPDKVSYSTLMMALMRYKREGAGDECRKLLSEMEQEYSNGNKNLQPDIINYANVIKALSVSKEPDAANDLLSKVESLVASGTCDFPTVACYNHVMSAYVRIKNKECLKRANEILERIRRAKANGNVKAVYDINTISIYMAAIEFNRCSFATLEDIKTAKEMFEEVCEREKRTEFGPSLELWLSLLIAAMNVSPPTMKAEISASIFQSMKESGVSMQRRDAVFACNLVLKACRWTKGDDKRSDQVLAISWEMLHILRTKNGLQPNSTTYYYLLQICNDHIRDQEEREKTMKTLIENCSKDGFLSDKKIRSCLNDISRDSNF